MKEAHKIWMNGELLDWDEAKVHVLSHGLHYGGGVFEGIRCYETEDGPAIFRLEGHMNRLLDSAKIYYKDLPYSKEELKEATKEVIKANNLESCYIRPIAFRGYGEMGLNPLECPIDVAIAVWPWGSYLGEEGMKKGIRVKISSYQRISPNVLPPNAKATGQYLNSILAKIEAVKADYEEALLLDHRGFISEGSGENLFVVKDGEIYTPPFHASILPGLTRDSVIKIAQDSGYKVNEVDLTRGFLCTSDEAFFTGTAAEVTPIREVNGREIGEGKPGEITQELQEKFFEVVRGKNPRYKDWLEYL